MKPSLLIFFLLFLPCAPSFSSPTSLPTSRSRNTQSSKPSRPLCKYTFSFLLKTPTSCNYEKIFLSRNGKNFISLKSNEKVTTTLWIENVNNKKILLFFEKNSKIHKFDGEAFGYIRCHQKKEGCFCEKDEIVVTKIYCEYPHWKQK